MIFDLDLRFAPPKGVDNPFRYYPEYYVQDKNQSIITERGRYDLTRFSAHESKIVRDVVFTSIQKYPSALQSLGLVNESYVITYKPRYVLFEIAEILFENSLRPEDRVAAAFAYAQRGAIYREKSIFLFENSIDYVSFRTLDQFASINSAALYLTMAELYEKEKQYEDAVYWIGKAIKRGGLNNAYLIGKMKYLKENPPKGRRMSKPSEAGAEFDSKVHRAALYFIEKYNLRVCEGWQQWQQEKQ